MRNLVPLVLICTHLNPLRYAPRKKWWKIFLFAFLILCH